MRPSGTAPAAGSARPRATRNGLQGTLLALASTLSLVGLLSCGSSPSTQNPSTLWLSFGQSELDLILSATEPPYYWAPGVRVGDSPDTIEAAYTLHGPITAGVWHLVGDGVVTGTNVTNITVQFDVRLRPQAAVADELDQVVLSTQNTFQRNADPQRAFAPVLYDGQVPGIAVAAVAGDHLVLRIHAVRGDSGAMYTVNGDGDHGGTYPGARIPHLDLPPSPPS